MLTQRASLLRKHAPIAALIIRCSSTSSTPSAPYDTIETTKDGPVGCITINRPSQLNALNSQVAGEKKSHGVYSSFRGVLTPHITYQVMHEVVHAARAFDGTEQVRTILLTGKGDKAFAAGADIKEMQSQGYADAYNSQVLGGWEGLRTVRKPLIAAVNGYALGGGCEVAMLCDIIVASDKASFGQPEIALGVIPGMGGTQRLTWAVGKYKAMDLLMTGRRISAEEAERMGLVSRVVPHDTLMTEAMALAKQIAGFSMPALTKVKDCVNMAMEVPLPQGVAYEKRLFWGCFALQDKQEGMAAFVAKRAPQWRDA